MPTLPIPIFVALVLGFLGLRAWAKGETPRPLLVLIAACAVQAAVVAGRLHYGIEGLSWVQPVLALALPPLGWVAFVSAARRPLRAGDLWHLAGPGFGLFARIFAREVLDVAILVSFVAYGVAVLLALRGGGEMAHARLGAGERPRRLWRHWRSPATAAGWSHRSLRRSGDNARCRGAGPEHRRSSGR